MTTEKIIQMVLAAVFNGILVGFILQWISRRWQKEQQDFQIRRQIYIDLCQAYYALSEIRRKYRGDPKSQEYHEKLKERINKAISAFKMLKHQALLHFAATRRLMGYWIVWMRATSNHYHYRCLRERSPIQKPAIRLIRSICWKIF